MLKRKKKGFPHNKPAYVKPYAHLSFLNKMLTAVIGDPICFFMFWATGCMVVSQTSSIVSQCLEKPTVRFFRLFVRFTFFNVWPRLRIFGEKGIFILLEKRRIFAFLVFSVKKE